MKRAGGTKFSRIARRPAVVGVLLVLLFGLTAVAANRGGMGTREQALFEWIYTMPNELEWFAHAVTQLGSGWFAVGLVGLLFVVKWDPRPTLVLARNAAAAYLLSVVLKLAVGRPRPVLLLHDFTARSVVAVGDGFPSGHTALATALSLSLLPYLPKQLRWIPLPWIVLVGWSRLYLGVHAPLDVLGGFLLGLIVVWIGAYTPWPRPVKKPQK